MINATSHTHIGFVSALILLFYPKVTVNVTCLSSKFIFLLNINIYDDLKMIFYHSKEEKEVTNLL